VVFSPEKKVPETEREQQVQMTAARLAVALARFTASTQHLHGAVVIHQHFGDITGDVLFILPGAGTQLALDIDLCAFTQIFPATSASLPNSTTRCHSVFSACSPVLSRHVSDVASVRLATAPPEGQITHLRILSQMTNQNDFINATCCHDESP
jgi:hypothetical protein